MLQRIQKSIKENVTPTREVKSAIANTRTQNTVYEVVYVEVIEQNDGLTKASFSHNPNKITADPSYVQYRR